MIKRKYGSRNVLPQQAAYNPIKRQRIQLETASDPLHTSTPTLPPLQPSTPKTLLEAWLKPAKLTTSQSLSPKLESDTPPSSSPPPNASQSEPESPQLLKVRKPTFAFLRRLKSAPIPLSDDTSGANQQRLPTQKPLRDKKLTQLTIDLGGPTTITCSECGMSYTPSQPDDAALHTRHHAAQLAKLNISSEVWKIVRERARWKDLGTGEYIMDVSQKDKVSLKNMVERVLDIASQDLGSLEIPGKQLWSRVSVQEQGARSQMETDRYRAFLFCKDRKCVGLLLAEHISTAFKVKDGSDGDTSKPLEISDEGVSAIVGISRIWTLNTERGNGIAGKLLEATRTTFHSHRSINKSKMAFSQPTEMGTALARKWFGKQSGWLVYRD